MDGSVFVEGDVALKIILLVLRRPMRVIFAVICLVSIFLAWLSYHQIVPGTRMSVVQPSRDQHNTQSLPLSPSLAVQDPAQILGIDGADLQAAYAGIPWVRLSHPSCGNGDLQGQLLRTTIQTYHRQGIHVLVTICQSSNSNLSDPGIFNDVAQSDPDAVQCGNEEMKQDASVASLYLPPDRFARFYALCERAVQRMHPKTPILLGSLDPHVATIDYQLLIGQVNYLDQLQLAMNTLVHPGGSWNWHTQTLGLIDSWHNGYEGANNLADIFAFWAQQFHLDPASGQLGRHLWVVEGTGCFKGCGLDPTNAAQIAVSHILALISDVQTAMRNRVPFFFFSGRDFNALGVYWPIGVLDSSGQPKPLRQDLAMGTRALVLTCPGGNVTVIDQLQLLAHLYARCTLPADYVSVLSG